MSAAPDGVWIGGRGEVLIGFGTAHLYGAVDALRSDHLLGAALAAGIDLLDTAPSYGGGVSEQRVGCRTRSRTGAGPTVTTKVGLEPTAARSTLVRGGSRLLPPALRSALRGRGAPGVRGRTGRFGSAAVRASVDRSLERLGHLDRLLLHEVAPDDVDDALLAVLREYVDAGDVTAVGTATGVDVTAAAMARGAGVLTVAQFAAGPYSPVPRLAEGVTCIGHGVFGESGSGLRLARTALRRDAALARRWHEATSGTDWAGSEGLATALLHRAAQRGLGAVVVATSRPDRLTGLRATVSSVRHVEPARWQALDEVLAAGRPGSRSGSRGHV